MVWVGLGYWIFRSSRGKTVVDLIMVHHSLFCFEPVSENVLESEGSEIDV